MLYEKRLGKVAVFDHSMMLIAQGNQIRQCVGTLPVCLSIGADKVTNPLDMMNRECVVIVLFYSMTSRILARVTIALAHSFGCFLPLQTVVVRGISAAPQTVIRTIFCACFADTYVGTITGFCVARVDLKRFAANLANFLDLAPAPIGAIGPSFAYCGFSMACPRTIESDIFPMRLNHKLFTACYTRLFDRLFVLPMINSSIVLRYIAARTGLRAKLRGILAMSGDYKFLTAHFTDFLDRFSSRRRLIAAFAGTNARTENSMFGNAAPNIERLSTCWAFFLHCCGRVCSWIRHLYKHITNRISFQGQMSPLYTNCITSSMDVISLE